MGLAPYWALLVSEVAGQRLARRAKGSLFLDGRPGSGLRFVSSK